MIVTASIFITNIKDDVTVQLYSESDIDTEEDTQKLKFLFEKLEKYKNDFDSKRNNVIYLVIR